MLTEDEKKFYRDLYRIINDPKVNDIIVTYAKKEYNKAVKDIRTKREPYEYGYGNGSADCWQHIIELKARLTEIMKNIG